MTSERIDHTTGEVLPATSAPAVSPLMLRPALRVADVKARVDFIREIQREVMERDIHYGVIPGTGKKPTLLKPGAELLCVTFQLDPEYEVLPQSVQTETFINYLVRCNLRHIPTGQIIATGLGACNSREEKYAYRTAARVCPLCGKPAIIKGKAEYGGGWLCFKKKEGCGAKFPDGATEIEAQAAGKVPNANIWDLANTLLKMGCKRAHIAATLNGTAASDTFTQDLEDLVGEDDPPPRGAAGQRPPAPEADDEEDRAAAEYEAAQRGKAAATPAPAAPAPRQRTLTEITDAQLRAVRSIARSKGMTPEAVEEFCRTQFNAAPEALNMDQASHLIKSLQAVA